MDLSQVNYSNLHHSSELRPQPELTDENVEMSILLATLQRIPLDSASFRHAMAAVLDHLRVADRALALGCGISSEFRFIPDTWGLAELNIVHGRYLLPMSYHLYSALGAAELLATGQGRPPHFALMIGCMLAIVRLLQGLPPEIANLRKAVTPRFVPIVDQSEQSLRHMVPAAQQALTISRSMVHPDIWEAAVRASQLARQVREKVAKSLRAESEKM